MPSPIGVLPPLVETDAAATLLNATSAAVVIIDDAATIVRANDAWTAFARTRGGPPLGIGDDYQEIFRHGPEDADAAARLAYGVATVIAGDGPAFRSEYALDRGGRRWLIGLDCRPLAGSFPPAFVCVHEHVATGPSGGMPGSFEVALGDIGDGLRRVEAALRAMVGRRGPRPRPASIALVIADVGAAISAGETTSIRRRLTDDGGGAEVVIHVAEGPFGSGPAARGTIIPAADTTPEPARAPAPGGEGDADASLVRRALAWDGFVLYAQPVFDLRSMEVHSHELLIRMREPNGHLRAPGRFLPAAERSGLIVEIDEWVIRRGAALAARGHDVSVNVSAASVGTPGFIETVAAILDAAGTDPRRVIMELTETAVVEDERPAREFINAMRALGCAFALDDFGTGYGGFTHIKHLAIDYLKIDREFVRDLDRDASSRHVVEIIVSLAGRFGLRTVAEGVESRACLEALSDLGVDYAQGYRLKRPSPLGSVFAECAGG